MIFTFYHLTWGDLFIIRKRDSLIWLAEIWIKFFNLFPQETIRAVQSWQAAISFLQQREYKNNIAIFPSQNKLENN